MFIRIFFFIGFKYLSPIHSICLKKPQGFNGLGSVKYKLLPTLTHATVSSSWDSLPWHRQVLLNKVWFSQDAQQYNQNTCLDNHMCTRTHSGVPDKHMPLCKPNYSKINPLKDLPKPGQSQSRFPKPQVNKVSLHQKNSLSLHNTQFLCCCSWSSAPRRERSPWSEVLGVSSSLSNHEINLSPLLFAFSTFEVVEAATSAKVHQTDWHSQLSSGSLLNLFPEVDVNAVQTDNYDEFIYS